MNRAKAPKDAAGSHFQKFVAIRDEFAALTAQNPSFSPAFPAAVNPVLRPPLRREGRVWLENEEAASTVDVANSAYALMLRLLAYSYVVPRPSPEKPLVVDLALGLMRAVTLLGERAARLPAGPSNPDCHAGMSFTALRDAAALLPGLSARRFFSERLSEIALGAANLGQSGDTRCVNASRIIGDLVKRAARGLNLQDEAQAAVPAGTRPAANTSASVGGAPAVPPVPTVIDGVEHIEVGRATPNSTTTTFRQWCLVIPRLAASG